MNGKEIKTGETYFFVATDSSARKHLEGTEFTVFEIKHVWRRRNKKSRQVKRFFNEFGEGARAKELEPLPSMNSELLERWKAAPLVGEPKPVSYGYTGSIDSRDFREDDGLPF